MRQGDILGPIHLPLLGKMPQKVISSIESVDAETGGEPDTMLVPASRRFVAVASHDCEFNENKRDRVLLARIQSAPKGPKFGEEQLAELRASNDIEARHAADLPVAGVDSFVLDPLPGHFDYPHIIVFTTITPYPARAVLKQLQAVKQAELQHSERLLLRRKLAWFFLRSEEDIDEGEKRPAAEVMREFRENTT